jgi:hypothetical protein
MSGAARVSVVRNDLEANRSVLAQKAKSGALDG